MSEEKTANRKKAEDSSSGHAHAELETESTARQSLTVPPDMENAEVLKQDASATLTSQKTQGVRPGRDNGAGVLQSAAKKAAHSNSRRDVHEYMRLRRNFV